MSIGKLQRFEELKTFKNVIQPDFDFKNCRNFEYKGKWSSLFENNNDIVLELGCGRGEYTLYLSQKYPNKNFIGIDIKGARIWRGAKEAIKKQINNVMFLRINIDFITYFFEKDEISELWIPHPDPQPKKPSKRLISVNFLSIFQNFLKDNSVINLKTDNTNLYNYALDIIQSNSFEILENYDDIHKADLKNEIVEVNTYYENMFLNQGEKIKFVKFLLKNAVQIEEPIYKFIPNYKY